MGWLHRQSDGRIEWLEINFVNQRTGTGKKNDVLIMLTWLCMVKYEDYYPPKERCVVVWW